MKCSHDGCNADGIYKCKGFCFCHPHYRMASDSVIDEALSRLRSPKVLTWIRDSLEDVLEASKEQKDIPERKLLISDMKKAIDSVRMFELALERRRKERDG